VGMGAPGTSFWQACWAALNRGVLAWATFWASSSAPPAWGSGKLTTPCERMHCANLSIACCAFAAAGFVALALAVKLASR
jgi:hypothetical protein